MGSLFDGTDNVISNFLRVDRENLNRKTLRVKPINDRISFALISEMYEILESNYRQVGAKPRSQSKKLWHCVPETNIKERNSSSEKILEKAVAMLAKKVQMPEWFNQCPVAAGITDPYKDNGRAVDLVRWEKANKCVHLVELKWESNTPLYALFEVLEYGLAYIFCRVHRKELPLQCPSLMDATDVSLEIVAPRSFYCDHHDKKDFFAQTSNSLDQFTAFKTGGSFSMSLKALAFPDRFQIPFVDGGEVKQKCDALSLTPEGKEIRDAFNNLTQLWP